MRYPVRGRLRRLHAEKMMGESVDGTFERRLKQVETFCEAALSRRTQFKFDKSRFGWSRIPLLGCVVGEGSRTVQQGKAQAVNDWPEPTCLEDVISFRAFANYLREFIPRFSELDQRLKTVTKKL